MIKNLQDTITLNNGVKMPGFGLGVYKVDNGETVVSSVKAALKHGYRLIDTASYYKNEDGVGQAIRESGIPREEIFVTTKVWNDEQGYESTLKAFDESLERLGLDYIDLYLIHWPIHKFKDTYRAFEELYKDGKVRAIGVSNFKIHHLEELLKDCNVVPAVNQVELHPRLTQKELRDYCEEKGIRIEAWAPLTRGQLFDHPLIQELSEKYGKTPAQIILRWDIQHGIITIPKSVKEERIIENANIFDFELTQEEMKQIDALNKDERIGSDPDTYAKNWV